MSKRSSVSVLITHGLAAVLLLSIGAASAGGTHAHGHDAAGQTAGDKPHGSMHQQMHRGGHSRMPGHADAEAHPFGRASDPARAAATIHVDMRDTLRFHPSVIEVERGETIRFVVRNRGKLMHEMVLGTSESLREHAQLMKRFPGMEHDEPHMAHVSPGQVHEMGWQFTNPGEYMYACLVPGHFDAGMKGKIVVR